MVVRRSRGVSWSGRRAVTLPATLLVVLSALQIAGIADVLNASHEVAFWVAFCSLVATAIGELARGGRLSAMLGSIAFFLGVSAALVATILLTVRIFQIGVEVVQPFPTQFMESVPFSLSGVMTLLFVLVACGVHAVWRRDARLVAPFFWLVVLSVVWVCASPDALKVNPAGGFERTSTTLLLLVGVSAVFVTAVIAGGVVARRRRWRLVRENPDALADPQVRAAGLVTSFSSVALVVGLLIVFHLLVPVRTFGSFRGTLLITAACAIVVAVSCFVLCGREWASGLGDAGFGLSTLAVASCISVLVPSQPVALSDRYPQLFNAMIVGFAIATAWWTWLSQAWRQQLDEGEAWTTAGRLIPHAKRFAFFSAALAFLCGVMMAFWPRLPGISTMDHSFGRIVAGFSANLFLLLVMLWSSRRLRRVTFHFLTLLVVASGAGFMVIRMLPFASDGR